MSGARGEIGGKISSTGPVDGMGSRILAQGGRGAGNRRRDIGCGCALSAHRRSKKMGSSRLVIQASARKTRRSTLHQVMLQSIMDMLKYRDRVWREEHEEIISKLDKIH